LRTHSTHEPCNTRARLQIEPKRHASLHILLVGRFDSLHRLANFAGEPSNSRQKQTVTLAWTDFAGGRPCRILIVARARTVTFDPRLVEARTVSVAR
jgi:hypothetical protein